MVTTKKKTAKNKEKKPTNKNSKPKGKRSREERKRRTTKAAKKQWTSAYLSINTLNVNGLKRQSKHKVAEWVKKNKTYLDAACKRLTLDWKAQREGMEKDTLRKRKWKESWGSNTQTLEQRV